MEIATFPRPRLQLTSSPRLHDAQHVPEVPHNHGAIFTRSNGPLRPSIIWTQSAASSLYIATSASTALTNHNG